MEANVALRALRALASSPPLHLPVALHHIYTLQSAVFKCLVEELEKRRIFPEDTSSLKAVSSFEIFVVTQDDF